MEGAKLTKEQQERFNRNFNQEAYYKAKADIQKIISAASNFGELWTNLWPYEKDSEYIEEGTIILCEVELDRSQMETEADYVGVTFDILVDESDKGRIVGVSLYTSDTPDGEVELMCYFNHNTCEVLEWCDD